MKNLLWLLFLYSSWSMADWQLKSKYEPDRPQYAAWVDRWDEDDNAPNPLRGCSGWAQGCLLAIYDNYIGYDGFPSNGGFISTWSLPTASDARTRGELAKAFMKRFQGGVLNSINFVWGKPREMCMTLAYYNVNNVKLLMPGGTQLCQSEVSPTACSISESEILLNHGTLEAKDVNGNTASQIINVSCNKKYRVGLMSWDGNGRVDLGEGLQSDLKVNGVDLVYYSFDVDASGRSLLLTSTLSGYTNQTGNFQGNKTLILIIP